MHEGATPTPSFRRKYVEGMTPPRLFIGKKNSPSDSLKKEKGTRSEEYHQSLHNSIYNLKQFPPPPAMSPPIAPILHTLALMLALNPPHQHPTHSSQDFPHHLIPIPLHHPLNLSQTLLTQRICHLRPPTRLLRLFHCLLRIPSLRNRIHHELP